MLKRLFPLVIVALCAGALALSQQQQQEKPFRIATSLSVVDLAVSFLDRNGAFLSNVQPSDVELTDNGKVQEILTFDSSLRPVSMAILVDTSTQIQGVLPNLRNSGILFTQLVMGATGEAAVLTYDETVQVRQDFTSDSDLVEKAFKQLKSEGDVTRLTDGVFRALEILKERPKDRRHVIVILGDGLDISGDTRRNQALSQAQLANVSIYTVQLSAFKTAASKSEPPPTVSVIPPGQPHEPGVPLGSNTGASGFGIGGTTFGGRSMKGRLSHAMKTYSDGTGSGHISATSNRAVSDAVQKIGLELHSQYWVSYRPNNLGDNPAAAEFHKIVVKVKMPGVKVRHRPGYFYSPGDSD